MKSVQSARIEAKGLSRHFGRNVALNDLTLNVEPGETFGLLGANGAGKTTFIRLVTGYLQPSSGSLLVDGISPATQPREVQARLGFAAETPRLYPELRVDRYLRFAGGVRGLSGEALEQAISRALDRFSLADNARRVIGNLSKGYQQRVSLAGAFLHDPPLVIVDEPTSGLDPLHRAEVRQVIADMGGQQTVLLCTHDLAEARELTQRVAILSHGRLVEFGPTEAVLGREDPLALFRGAPTPGATG
jgi:ABC-2 type transport system ATP-binding protein